jgi:hypothetical protein
VECQAAAGLSHGTQLRVGCVFYAGALLAAYKRRFWPLMFFGGTAYLLKLWFLDRKTLYYEIRREREEPPKEEQAEAKMGGRI